MKHVLFQLKAKDIVVLMGTLFQKGGAASLTELSEFLHMSHSEVHQSLKRAQIANLYDPLTKKAKRAAFEEFLIHGLPYVFPARPGPVVIGVETAHSAEPLSSHITSHEEDVYVWPHKLGGSQGRSITPLAAAVPYIALDSPTMHEALALVDALRVGRSREREYAKSELPKRIRQI